MRRKIAGSFLWSETVNTRGYMYCAVHVLGTILHIDFRLDLSLQTLGDPSEPGGRCPGWGQVFRDRGVPHQPRGGEYNRGVIHQLWGGEHNRGVIHQVWGGEYNRGVPHQLWGGEYNRGVYQGNRKTVKTAKDLGLTVCFDNTVHTEQ